MPEGFQTGGPFDQGSYAQLTYQIHTLGLSGVLRIVHAKRIREIFYVGGLPVLYKTSLPEEQLTKTLLFGNLVSKSRLNKVLSRVDERTSLEEALLKSRLIRRKQLDQHLTTRLRNGIGAPIHWTKGEWSFQAQPQLKDVAIDLELLPQVSVLNSLWLGVRQHISMDAVMALVRNSAPAKDSRNALEKTWLPAPDLEQKISGFQLEAPFDRLKEFLSEGGSPDGIMSQLPDSSGNLVKLLWLLETIGILEVEGLETNQQIVQQLQIASSGEGAVKAVSEEKEAEESTKTRVRGTRKRKRSAQRTRRTSAAPESAPPAGANENQAGLALEKDHRSRLNQNFYDFLELAPTSTKAEVETASKRLAQRWRSALNSHRLDDRGRQQAKELLSGLRQVWNVLKNDEDRTGYDRQLKGGKAPLVQTEAAAELNQILGDLPGANPTQETSVDTRSLLEQGNAYLEENHFQTAWNLLEKARQENPSCPDTLAALGWAAYHVKHQTRLEEDPEDFLRLALTFEPNHLQALEYHARISLRKGDMERAETFLSRLTKANPKATWAQRELSQIRSAQSRDSNRRFWRKGDGE